MGRSRQLINSEKPTPATRQWHSRVDVDPCVDRESSEPSKPKGILEIAASAAPPRNCAEDKLHRAVLVTTPLRAGVINVLR